MDAGILSSGGVSGLGFAEATPADTARCLERFFRWGAAPTVDGYCDLFAPGGTLLDADMEAPITGAAIRESITRVLLLLPDFRFTPVQVVAEGRHAFVRAANRATLGERPLAWEAVYALTISGDRIGAGRRYYDRAALVSESPTFGSPAAGSDAAAATTGDAHAAAGAIGGSATPSDADLAARAVAWSQGDVAALVAPLAGMRLHMAGVGATLDGEGAIRSALTAFLARSGGLRLTLGAVARTATATAVEWVGTIGAGGAARRFALVEIAGGLPNRREWHLVFDTFGL